MLMIARRRVITARGNLTRANNAEASASGRGQDLMRVAERKIAKAQADLAAAEAAYKQIASHFSKTEITLGSLVKTARNALDADRSTPAGESAYELAVSHVLHGLADMATDGRAAAE